MQRITIELIEDEKVGGYTIVSDNILGDDIAVVAEGDTVMEAIENFKDALYDIQQYLKEEKNA